MNNSTSETQSLEFSWEAESSFNANLTISSTEKSAVPSELGMTIGKSYSASGTLTLNVAPQTKAWIIFTPIKYKSCGVLTRYVYGLAIESKYVTTYTSSKVYNSFILKTVPDGV